MPFFKKRPLPPEWLIVGLGNPGKQYEFTRHNAGFLCVDMLAAALGARVDKLKFHALFTAAQLGETRCALLKPQTFMNNSGQAAAQAAAFYRIPPERVLVIFDDVLLPPGALRIRRKGSDGGHNGVKSVISHLRSSEFPRIKLGIGERPRPEDDLADWVLSAMPKNDLSLLRGACENASRAAALILSGKMDEAMAKYSR
ncbi:MAG: aminoacyl-tRNA hydrolase [Oscillospiraceae bacterium]|nr:aminoacyl-tRNA hydrolase [Oscillospiraceae bacterium]